MCQQSSRLPLRPWCLAVLLLLGSGCTSLVLQQPDGRPQLYGLGWVQELETQEGRLFRIRAPGSSLRVAAPWAGWTLGFHETLLFFATAPTGALDPSPVAMQTRAYGLNVTPSTLALGFERTLAIPYPPSASVIQLFSYNQDAPHRTVIFRKEIP